MVNDDSKIEVSSFTLQLQLLQFSWKKIEDIQNAKHNSPDHFISDWSEWWIVNCEKTRKNPMFKDSRTDRDIVYNLAKEVFNFEFKAEIQKILDYAEQFPTRNMNLLLALSIDDSYFIKNVRMQDFSHLLFSFRIIDGDKFSISKLRKLKTEGLGLISKEEYRERFFCSDYLSSQVNFITYFKRHDFIVN